MHKKLLNAMDRRTRLAWISWWTEREAQAHALAVVFESQSSHLDTELILWVQPGTRKMPRDPESIRPNADELLAAFATWWSLEEVCLPVKADHSNRRDFYLLWPKLSVHVSDYKLTTKRDWLGDCGTAIVGQVVAYRYRSQWAAEIWS